METGLNATERTVRSVWAEVLQCETSAIAVDMDIMDVGGSVELIQIILELNEAFDSELPLDVLLDRTTVRSMAAVFDNPPR
ncbi:acyl carrier protein [Actinoplanes derwentensis]|uniref:Phosphopantetheine attachment site n=1 Tax=Actinoplanes derwentensis TaxID=113562 RepID=A0A1H2DCU2_9ACTN|nr:hypothetical protein Ade03nite_84970 [Actinoplanes derwentensis]SDT80550.1 Phosphopantetheine attachment site [Actinoplanes derwentensis]